MIRNLLVSSSTVILLGTLGVGESLAFGPGIPGMPGLGGGGGGTNAITEKAKAATVNKILKEVGKNAFKSGKIIASKQKWACDKLAKAETIVRVINKPDLVSKVSDLRQTLYCGLTEAIPAEMLAPEKEKIDTQET